MKIIYIAGPFRGKNGWEVEKNVRRAEEFAFEILEMGGGVICPHTNTRFFDGTLEDSFWLDMYLELIERCDAVAMMPSWFNSAGATTEREHAIHRDIPILEGMEAIKRFIEEG